jgi:hypothetical protein
VTSAELIQFGEQIANLHRRRIENAPGRRGSPALRRRQATVERFPDHGGDRCTALPRESADPLVALIVDENLQPVRQHAHTLACAYGARRLGSLCGRLLNDLVSPACGPRLLRSHAGTAWFIRRCCARVMRKSWTGCRPTGCSLRTLALSWSRREPAHDDCAGGRSWPVELAGASDRQPAVAT